MQFPYLTTRRGSRNWTYKRPVPLELQAAFNGKKQIWISLRTPDKQEAMQVYHKVADEVESQFERARLGSPTGTAYFNLKRERLKRFHSAKKNIFAYTEETDGSDWFDPAIMTVEDAVGYQENDLAKRRIKELEQAKTVGTVDVRKADEEIEALQHLIDGTAPDNEPKSSTAPLLKDVLTEYLDEVRPSLAPTTFNKKETHLQEFLTVCGNKHIDGFTLEDGTRFASHLKNLVGKATGKKLHANTINGYIRNVKKMFRWSLRYNPKLCNPVEHIDRIAEKKVATDKKPRLSFSQSELEAIFSKIKVKDSFYWPCLIALYTGCRGGEIIQLRVEDIQTKAGIAYFDIHDRGGNKLKNDQSNRQVPVHETLVDLGFLEYVEKLGTGTLFPAICKGDRWRQANGSDKWTNSLGHRFRRFLVNNKIKHKRISFHSFRHTFTDGCRNNGVSESVWNWLQGRTEKGSVGGYGVGPNMKIKKDEIDKIKYGLSIED